MNTKLTIVLSLSVILISILAGVLVYGQMPEQVASHWGANDQVDGYMSKFWGVFMMPIMSIGILALFLIIPNLDPLKDNIAEFREIFNLFIFVIMLFLVYIWALTIFWNLGFNSFKMSTAILPAMGFLFLLVGYMLREAKRNWFVGIRTPWTLSSDTVWNEIHRLGSKLFIASGVLSFLSVFFEDYAIWFVLVPVLGSTFFLYIYSYILFRKETMSAK